MTLKLIIFRSGYSEKESSLFVLYCDNSIVSLSQDEMQKLMRCQVKTLARAKQRALLH